MGINREGINYSGIKMLMMGKKYVNQDLLVKSHNIRKKPSPWELIFVFLEKGLNIYQIYLINCFCLLMWVSFISLSFLALILCL